MLLPPVCAHLSVLIQTERAWRAGTTSLTCVCASVCVCFYTHLGSFCIWNLVSIYFTLKLKIQLHLLCLAQGREMLINICWIICNVCQYLPKWVILHVDLYALEGRHTRSCWATHTQLLGATLQQQNTQEVAPTASDSRTAERHTCAQAMESFAAVKSWVGFTLQQRNDL